MRPSPFCTVAARTFETSVSILCTSPPRRSSNWHDDCRSLELTSRLAIVGHANPAQSATFFFSLEKCAFRCRHRNALRKDRRVDPNLSFNPTRKTPPV
jgi:hypothetical protein